jgi:hypothetical protein
MTGRFEDGIFRYDASWKLGREATDTSLALYALLTKICTGMDYLIYSCFLTKTSLAVFFFSSFFLSSYIYLNNEAMYEMRAHVRVNQFRMESYATTSKYSAVPCRF